VFQKLMQEVIQSLILLEDKLYWVPQDKLI